MLRLAFSLLTCSVSRLIEICGLISILIDLISLCIYFGWLVVLVRGACGYKSGGITSISFGSKRPFHNFLRSGMVRRDVDGLEADT